MRETFRAFVLPNAYAQTASLHVATPDPFALIGTACAQTKLRQHKCERLHHAQHRSRTSEMVCLGRPAAECHGDQVTSGAVTTTPIITLRTIPGGIGTMFAIIDLKSFPVPVPC